MKFEISFRCRPIIANRAAVESGRPDIVAHEPDAVAAIQGQPGALGPRPSRTISVRKPEQT